ncbi:MAG: FMN-binding negative transcriptional regulator [Acidiferrobacterales bacterium]
MYIPEYFRELGRERLDSFVRQHGFGTLISNHDGLPFASHLPFLLERGDDGVAKLLGHMARANPQWQSLNNGDQVLAIFQGPHAYISPSWYLSPGVPTWNYAAVHVYGTASTVDDAQFVRNLLERLTTRHEAHLSRPWEPGIPEAQFERMLGAIVAFEIRIARIEGKFKLSQNRSEQDRSQVIEQLRRRGSSLDAELARLMEAGQEV